jgi:hypothetical protein
MRISEYEERFQRPAPSWLQLLTVNQRPNRIRHRRRRCLLAAALITVVTLTLEAAIHSPAHGHGGTGSAATGPGLDLALANFRRVLDFFEGAGQSSRQAPHAQKSRSQG